jgi:hypothetical protein
VTFQKYIAENKSIYLRWLNDGNIPEEVPFVPTPIEERRELVKQQIALKSAEGFDAGFEYQTHMFPSQSSYREIMRTGAELAQYAIDNGETLTKYAFDITGTPIELNETQLIELYNAYKIYAQGIYDIYTNEMITVSTASSAELDYYLSNGAFA